MSPWYVTSGKSPKRSRPGSRARSSSESNVVSNANAIEIDDPFEDDSDFDSHGSSNDSLEIVSSSSDEDNFRVVIGDIEMARERERGCGRGRGRGRRQVHRDYNNHQARSFTGIKNQGRNIDPRVSISLGYRGRPVINLINAVEKSELQFFEQCFPTKLVPSIA